MSNVVENFLRSMVWSKDATDHEKSLVAGNIRTFYHWLMEQQPHGAASWQARCYDAEDRLAKLEDGIRALAGQLDTEPPDNTLIHDDVGTVADVAKRLRALLVEDGE